MFGFGWVRTHLGVVFGDAFGVFCWISGKRDEISKIWANFGVLRRDVGIPCSNVGPRQGIACPRSGVAERRLFATLRRSTVHSIEIFVFCFVLFFPLLRGLVCWINDDPISV